MTNNDNNNNNDGDDVWLSVWILECCSMIIIIIITPYILGSIYSAKANRAEQIFETNNLNQA